MFSVVLFRREYHFVLVKMAIAEVANGRDLKLLVDAAAATPRTLLHCLLLTVIIVFVAVRAIVLLVVRIV